MTCTEQCREFWTKFSNQCDNRSMMLSAEAEQIEASDRNNVLKSLPDLTNMDVVEVGCGIGRFTSTLAQSAHSVLATDIIGNFVVTNQRRNMHLKNITYRVCDALNLKLPETSVDFVFTNWLLMYLSDSDVILFLQNVLRYLRPGGYLHLRESCTQPSSNSTSGSFHLANEVNPTRYRYSSVYMKLLRNISYQDEKGNVCGFELLWASSIQTYIIHRNNWRQVHWLVRKHIKSVVNICENQLLSLLSFGWKQEQDQWDAIADNKLEKCSNEQLDDVFSTFRLPKQPEILIYNGSNSDQQTYIDPQHFAEQYNGNVSAVETNEYSYRRLLTRAHRKKDHRVQIFWNQNIRSMIQYWKKQNAHFDAIILVGVIDSESIEYLKEIVNIDAPLLIIAPEFESQQQFETVLCSSKSMLKTKIISLKDLNGSSKYKWTLYHCQYKE